MSHDLLRVDSCSASCLRVQLHYRPKTSLNGRIGYSLSCLTSLRLGILEARAVALHDRRVLTFVQHRYVGGAPPTVFDLHDVVSACNITLAFSCGARSAVKLKGKNLLEKDAIAPSAARLGWAMPATIQESIIGFVVGCVPLTVDSLHINPRRRSRITSTFDIPVGSINQLDLLTRVFAIHHAPAS